MLRLSYLFAYHKTSKANETLRCLPLMASPRSLVLHTEGIATHLEDIVFDRLFRFENAKV